jgi:hypothetical protein
MRLRRCKVVTSYKERSFDCPAHEIAREELLEKIDGDEFHLSDTMLDADRMKFLVTFVNRTRRLRQWDRELPVSQYYESYL